MESFKRTIEKRLAAQREADRLRALQEKWKPGDPPVPGPSHPLESIVLDAFKKTPTIDATSLIPYLAGAYFVGKRSEVGNKAYRVVAEDVLGCMKQQGKLIQDKMGWYMLAPKGG